MFVVILYQKWKDLPKYDGWVYENITMHDSIEEIKRQYFDVPGSNWALNEKGYYERKDTCLIYDTYSYDGPYPDDCLGYEFQTFGHIIDIGDIVPF